MARVASDGARISVSGFMSGSESRHGFVRRWIGRLPDIDVVQVDRLEGELARAGFDRIRSELIGASVGYVWARRAARLPA
jgi:hypothetical protein